MYILEKHGLNVSDLSILQADINKLDLSIDNRLLFMESIDLVTYFNFESEPSPQYSALIEMVIDSHDPSSPLRHVQGIIRAAQDFGSKIIFDFTVENVLLGITQLGLTSHVRRVTTPIITALTTGSLYDAISEVKVLDPSDLDAVILTPARLLSFRNRIETYLEIPLAQSWNE